MAPAAMSYKQALLAKQAAAEAFDAGSLVKNFIADNTLQTLELSSSLTADQRKQVKREAEKCADLRCDSFGFGSERQLHLFKRTSVLSGSARDEAAAEAAEGVAVKVKNTFIDDWVATGAGNDGEPVACRSMPASLVSPNSRLTGMINEKLPAIAEMPVLVRGDSSGDSTCASDASAAPSPAAGSPVCSFRELPAPAAGLQVRNTFIHFGTQPADERVVQSMPDGMFSQLLQAEQEARASAVQGDAGAESVAESAAPAAAIVPGAVVSVQGLTKAPAFNGRCGTVQGFDADSGRYLVMLTSSATGEPASQMAKLKLENLVIVTPLVPPRRSAPCLDLEDSSAFESDSPSIPCTPMWDEVQSKATLSLNMLV